MSSPAQPPAAAPAYPPQPWHLAGRGWISLWRPVRAMPPLPRGVRPVGRTAVTMFVDYGAGGQMAYAALLAGVLVHRGPRVGLSITDIWVDSPASMAGGRELWGVPKRLAAFEGLDASGTDGALSAVDPEGELASARFSPGRPSLRLPLPLPAAIAQTMPCAPIAGEHGADEHGADRPTRTVWTPVRAGARSLRPARARWSSPPGGDLDWLIGARPIAGVVAEGFAMTFGR